jgi:hypothetical protein
MLIDRYLPNYDVTEVSETSLHAPPDVTYAAIRETNLSDPVVTALFALRELPLRIVRKWRNEPHPTPTANLTFGTMIADGPGWVLLAEEPGVELVIGSVGRFWRRDYGGRAVTAEEFIAFSEPGYAKLALSFLVLPSAAGRTILRYEARTATTDDAARRWFRRYWRLIRPGVALVMRRALRRIKVEAERRAALPVVSPAGV